MTEPDPPPIPDDPIMIADDDGLIRHCPTAERKPVKLPEGGYRIPSNAFSLRVKNDERYVSVDIESLLTADGLEPTARVNRETHWAIRITAGSVRGLGLGVTHEPEGHHKYHGGIHGLVSLNTSPRERIQKRLAERSEIVIIPEGYGSSSSD